MELRDAVPKEFDFVREARLTEAIGGNLRAGGHCRVRTPRVLTHLSSARLLVLERMEGAHGDVTPTGSDVNMGCPLRAHFICGRF